MEFIILKKDELKATLTEMSQELSEIIVAKIRAENTGIRPVLTMSQLAEYLQVSTQSIRNWMRRAENDNPLPHHGVGGDPRFHLDEINSWSRQEVFRQKRRPSPSAKSRKTKKKQTSTVG